MAKDTGKKPAKKKDPDAVNERYRITIPEVDEAARRWAAHQSNLSLSIRILIRKCVLELGYVDVAVREMDVPFKRGPGRPRKDAAKLLSGQAVPVPPRAPSLLSGGAPAGVETPAEPARERLVSALRHRSERGRPRPRRTRPRRPRRRRGPSTTCCARGPSTAASSSSRRWRPASWAWASRTTEAL